MKPLPKPSKNPVRKGGQPREHLNHLGIKLSPKQNHLLTNSQKLRSTLFKLNEAGKPTQGTRFKSKAGFRKIFESNLPRKIKLIERDKWGETIASHLIFRVKQSQAQKTKATKKLGREPTPQEIFNQKVSKKEIFAEKVDGLAIFEQVQLDLAQEFPV